MKILILNTFYKPYNAGGAEKITELMSLGFKERGDAVFILTLGQKGMRNIEEIMDGNSVVRIPIKNMYFHHNKSKKNVLEKLVWHILDIYNPFMKKDVERVLLKIKPEVVVCHNIVGFSASVWSIFKKHNIPVLQILHDLYSLCPNSNMFNGKEACKKRCFKCSLFRFMHSYYSKDVDAVVGVSRFVLDKHLEYDNFTNSKIKTFIHNVLKVNSLPDVNFEYKSKSPIFGYIGALTPSKGIEKLLDAFYSIDNSEIKILIAGKGAEEYEDYLRSRYKKENIKFLGYVKSENFINQIDVLIVPSICNDTLPTVILESFINGIPVVGSRIGGIPELVNEDNGWLFDAGDIDDLMAIIEDLIKEPYKIKEKKDFIIKNRNNYINFEKWISDYTEVINAVIKRKYT